LQPDIADGVVLTGISYNGSDVSKVYEAFNPRIAAVQNPQNSGGRDSGYVAWVGVFGNVNTYVHRTQEQHSTDMITGFFKAPSYEADVALFIESTKQPFAIAELLTNNALNLNAGKFDGPAMVSLLRPPSNFPTTTYTTPTSHLPLDYY